MNIEINNITLVVRGIELKGQVAKKLKIAIVLVEGICKCLGSEKSYF